MEGPRIQNVLEGRAKQSGRSVEEEKKAALATQSLKRFVDPRDIAALAVFLASDAASRSRARCCRSTTTRKRRPEFGGNRLTREKTTWLRRLREQLIGAWKLVSYVEKPVDGSAAVHPLGERPMGIIMYTPDGYMSAQLMRPGRRPFASGDWFDGTAKEYREEASTTSRTPGLSTSTRRRRR